MEPKATNKINIYCPSEMHYFNRSEPTLTEILNDILDNQARDFIEENIELFEENDEKFFQSIPVYLIDKVFEILKSAGIEISSYFPLYTKKYERELDSIIHDDGYLTNSQKITLDTLGV